MLALLTSCGRHDLLVTTVNSFMKDQQEKIQIIINEDAPSGEKVDFNSPWIMTQFSGGIGQHKSIENFLLFASRLKYYLHLEDDFEFSNTYNWIRASMEIMESDPTVIKVLACDGTPHPCTHDQEINGRKFGYIQPWTGNDSIKWHGWSFNPGVTRLDLLKQFIPFPKWEQELAEEIYNKGYKVVELSDKVYRHIGENRSTH